MFSISCWALGDRISGYSGDDIRVNGLTAADILARGVRELVHQVTAVRGSFPTIKLRFPFGDGHAERGNPLLLGLHAPDGIADDFGGVPIEAAGDLGPDIVLHLGREVYVHSHDHKISIVWSFHKRNLPSTESKSKRSSRPE